MILNAAFAVRLSSVVDEYRSVIYTASIFVMSRSSKLVNVQPTSIDQIYRIVESEPVEINAAAE